MMITKSVVRRLLGFLWSFHWLLILSFLFALLSVFLNVIAPLLIGEIIDAITIRREIDIAFQMLLWLIISYVFYSFFHWIMMYTSNRIAFSSSARLRRQLYDKLEHLPVSFYDQHARGDMISRFVNDIDLISDGFLHGLSTMMSGVATIVMAIYFMLNINLIMSCIVMISAPFTYVVARFITKRTQKYFAKQASDLGRMNGYGEEMLSGIRTVKAFHYEQHAEEQFQSVNQQLYTSGVKSQFYGSLANPSTRFVMNLAYAVVGVSGAVLALTSRISIGNISSFLMYSNLFSKPFTEITGVMTQLQSAVASGKRIFAILDLPEEKDDQTFDDLSVSEGSVSFEAVQFAYEKSRPLMKDICLQVPGGSRVAVVGRTGAGKTTLVNLLMRFYDLDQGRILIDGQPIDSYRRDSLRKSFGMVLQDTYLFEGSIAENIAYGKPEAAREEIIAAAKKSGAHAFIRRLQNGYDTQLHTNSSTLSLGQRQLLSITRVLLMNPSMLILDEATSSIDTLSEQHVNAAMEVLMKGKTSFIIAHRLSTIVDADLILVMDHGTILEQGTHAQLLQRNGSYRQLFNAQFA